MPTKGKGAARQYLQSEGNLALSGQSLGIAQEPKTKHLSPVTGVAQSVLREQELPVGAVFSVRLILALAGLTLMLWGLTVLIMYWIRLRL